jgi:hypothetical protein
VVILDIYFGSLSTASTCAIKDNVMSDMTQARVSDLFGAIKGNVMLYLTVANA